MSRIRFLISLIMASLIGGLIVLGGVKFFQNEIPEYNSFEEKQNVRFSSLLADSSFTVPAGLNFVYAAEQVTPGVVHIKSSYGSKSQETQQDRDSYDEYFREFFGEGEQGPKRRGPSMSSGSGVIISGDGYIVTNNHVIENAETVQVTLNDNRTYTAEVVGKDPTTDLALLKVDEKNLPFVRFGNSDDVKIGEWVLAVGNPFELNSTVTAGIISAKARNIGILRTENGMQIESFLQTDAAVNPGNSGGALVNLKGELLGINTAIYAPTGSFAGYSFAVPVSLVRKVMDDLLEFGTVQRALLGVRIADITSQFAEQQGLEEVMGVYINEVNANSAAEEAGLQEGDIIMEIDDTKVSTVARLQEKIALNRPGEEVKVTYKRDGETFTSTAVLKGAVDREEASKLASFSVQGATFKDIDQTTLNELGITGGVRVAEISEGKWKEAGIKSDFIITEIDKSPVENAEGLALKLKGAEGGILIGGVYPNGQTAFYALGW